MYSFVIEKLPYPKAVGFIVLNEFCERFSYYGLRTILSLYLRDKLAFSDNGATVIFHTFSMFAYFFPIFGAIIADSWLGRFKTILYLSIVYACGSLMISITAISPIGIPPLPFTMIGLMLVAMGTGGIKPCVSAFGGDQFKLPEQQKYLEYFFSLFYFSINAGSLISTFLTPILRADVHCFGEASCYCLGFGVPGFLMITAIILFVAGKRLYIIKKPKGNVIVEVSKCIGYAAANKCKSKEKKGHWLDHAAPKYTPQLIKDIKSLLTLLVLYVPLPVFWALFEQQGSRWIFQADRMNQAIGNYSLKPEQMQALNPLLVLFLIPMFQLFIYPFLYRVKLIRKPLHKIIYGGFLASLAFVISGIVELNLLPTYGNPVTANYGQLRIYNGFDTSVTFKDTSRFTRFNIAPLSVYENVLISVNGERNIPYILLVQGKNIKYEGTFTVKEKTANSYFVSGSKVLAFEDNVDKAIGSVNIRFLTNINAQNVISLYDGQNGQVVLNITSDDYKMYNTKPGTYNVDLGDNNVMIDHKFQAGATYVIIAYQTSAGTYVLKTVVITPPNTIHILWLIPQYVVMTMSEVMFSITGLEFSFTQSPESMKSVLQSVWLLNVACGNLIVVLIVQGNFLDAQWKEFFLFAGLMAVVMLIFTMMALRYKYVEHDDEEGITKTNKDNNDETPAQTAPGTRGYTSAKPSREPSRTESKRAEEARKATGKEAGNAETSKDTVNEGTQATSAAGTPGYTNCKIL